MTVCHKPSFTPPVKIPIARIITQKFILLFSRVIYNPKLHFPFSRNMGGSRYTKSLNVTFCNSRKREIKFEMCNNPSPKRCHQYKQPVHVVWLVSYSRIKMWYISGYFLFCSFCNSAVEKIGFIFSDLCFLPRYKKHQLKNS